MLNEIKVEVGHEDWQVTTPDTIRITFPGRQDWHKSPGHDEQFVAVQMVHTPFKG